MAQFEQVLDGVRQVLTSASPADIQSLLEVLVEERIISQAYSKSLSPHRLTSGIASELVHSVQAREPASDLRCSQGATTQRHLSPDQLRQVRRYGSSKSRDPAFADLNCTRSDPVSPADEHYSTVSRTEFHPLCEYQVTDGKNCKTTKELMGDEAMNEHYLDKKIISTQVVNNYQCNLGLNDEITELLRSAESMQKPVRENERIDEGNSQDEKEWLEQVEEAARRMAVPLWQHWDRGQKMLLPLVSCATSVCKRGENAVAGSEGQCSALNMEEEIELAVACRTLGLYSDKCTRTEAEITRFTLDTEGDTPEGLHFPAYESVATAGLNTDHVGISGAATSVDTNNVAERLQGNLDVCWGVDGMADATEDLFWLTGDAQCGTDAGFPGEMAQLFSPSTPKDILTDALDSAVFSNTDHSVTTDVTDSVEHFFRAACGTKTCITGGITDLRQIKEDEGRADSHWGAKMQDVDQGLGSFPDLGDLPDDLSPFFDEDYLRTIMDTGLLFGDPLLSEEELNPCSDVPIPTVPLSPDSHPQRQSDKLTRPANSRRKRSRAPQSQQCTDENTPSRPKKQRAAGRPKTKAAEAEAAVTQDTERGSESSAAETPAVATTPPRIIHLHPSIQFIALSDLTGYQVVRAEGISPPVIRLPLPSAAARPASYFFVPATPPPCKRQVPPLSPVGGTVAPVQMSSSPPGSLSDSASKAMSPPCASPVSPSNETSTCKESPPPQSPTVFDIPQVVKEYIKEAKAHVIQTCQEMEAGLSLNSHFVDVKVSQREILRSGKNTNKLLDKELVIMGHTDRNKSLLGKSQIFEGSNGDKAKRYILLLGNAGMGKTTLIRKLCLDWSRDLIPQFDFVFFLDGKALTLQESSFSLQTLLLNHTPFAPLCRDPEAVYTQILAAPKRVLVVFDGFDELRDYETLLQTQDKDLLASLQRDSKAQTYTVKQLYSAILQRVLLPGCTLLLSTRPRGTASQLLRRTDSLLEVCGFTPTDIETYLSQYFTDPDLSASALDCLKSCSYLRLLCWNPGLCRLVCLLLEHSKSPEVLPRTLTGLCHQVLRLRMEKYSSSTEGAHSPAEGSQTSVQSVDETLTQISGSPQVKRGAKNTQTKSRSQVRNRTRSRNQRTRGAQKQQEEEGEEDGEEMKCVGGNAERADERELLSQLSSLAWEGVKANSSILPTGRTIPAKLKAFGHSTGLLLTYHLRTRQVASSGEEEEGKGQHREEIGRGEREEWRKSGADVETVDACDELIVRWANPFLQSYLAGVHLSLSRTVSDRTFLQTLPFHSGPKGRRRPQREELELTQRFAVGLLYHNRTELQRLHSYTGTVFRDMVLSKQALVTKHLEGLSHGDLSSAQVLEACHYVYEASSTRTDGGGDSGSTQLVAHLAANLPEILTFRGVPLNPADVFTVQNVLERGGAEGRSFCLDLEDSGIQIAGIRALVGLNNINTYRACIADVITLWEQLEQGGEQELLQGAVSKFKIHPLKATQVCHIEHLANLVNIHMCKRLSDSSSQSDSILAEGVPAVRELHKLEFELGPEKGPLALPKLWELLPGLQNLQHLDLENSKIGDKGAEKLADALGSLHFLEVLNLSQNSIGDQGVKKLATTLKDLPKLHCLSLYSNVISDEGAESLAAVLPHVASLTDLDVKFNKLTDVGAQSLGVSLRNCKRMKTLRMWNQCIPYGVFERLQQQDSRILCH